LPTAKIKNKIKNFQKVPSVLKTKANWMGLFICSSWNGRRMRTHMRRRPIRSTHSLESSPSPWVRISGFCVQKFATFYNTYEPFTYLSTLRTCNAFQALGIWFCPKGLFKPCKNLLASLTKVGEF
jgi:hypothetical protein